MMLDLSGVSRVGIRELSERCLFVPVAEDGCYFLAGRMREVEMLVALDGEKPFFTSERSQWTRPPGLQIPGVRFEVDLDTKTPVQGSMDLKKGMLLLSGHLVGIVARENSGNFPIWLTHQGQGTSDAAAGFTSWQIVTGSGADKQILFKHPANQGS